MEPEDVDRLYSRKADNKNRRDAERYCSVLPPKQNDQCANWKSPCDRFPADSPNDEGDDQRSCKRQYPRNWPQPAAGSLDPSPLRSGRFHLRTILPP